ncbi:MAG: hypothetical protein V4485_00020 [Pseudomonadota bacterium]
MPPISKSIDLQFDSVREMQRFQVEISLVAASRGRAVISDEETMAFFQSPPEERRKIVDEAMQKTFDKDFDSQSEFSKRVLASQDFDIAIKSMNEIRAENNEPPTKVVNPYKKDLFVEAYKSLFNELQNPKGPDCSVIAEAAAKILAGNDKKNFELTHDQAKTFFTEKRVNEYAGKPEGLKQLCGKFFEQVSARQKALDEISAEVKGFVRPEHHAKKAPQRSSDDGRAR